MKTVEPIIIDFNIDKKFSEIDFLLSILEKELDINYYQNTNKIKLEEIVFDDR